LLIELILAILIARLMAFILDRFEIPAITAYIVTGIILGPSVLNLISGGMPEDLVTLTFFFLLFYTGLNVDFKGIREYLGKSLVITCGGVGLTIFLAVALLSTYMKLELLPALVIAIAISNTATEIVVVMLEHSYEVSDEFRRILVMSSFIDDILAILFMSLLRGAILGEIADVSYELLRLMGFFIVSVTVIALVTKYVPRLIYPLVVNWDYLLFLSSVIFFGMVYAAHVLGISEIFGAYIAGLIIGMLRLVHDPTVMYTVRVEEFVLRMSTVLEFFIIPIFFVYIGYNTLVSQLLSPLSLIILGIAFAGKFIGVAVTSAPWSRPAQSITLGLAMNVRGSIEPAVALVALERGIITQDLFSAVVAVSLFTSAVIPVIFNLITRLRRI